MVDALLSTIFCSFVGAVIPTLRPRAGAKMKLGDGAAAAGQPGVSRDSQALLNALRPFCMSAMMALEGMLHSGSERVRLVYPFLKFRA